jgi:hypothetical protein
MMAQDREGFPFVVLTTLPRLALEIGAGFVRFQARRKRGVRHFRRELIAAGMPTEQASQLAQQYHDAGSVRRILRRQGGP